MAVVVETTIGDFTIDLFIDSRPQVCKNFLKLCKMKYYNFCLFHSVQPNFLAQTGDPSGVGSGGESIYGLLYGENERFFEGEVIPKIKHSKPGLVSMVNCGNNMLGSQFFVTLGEELVSLDGEHCVFGEISEGIEIIHKLNEAICDTQHRPYKDIRITHTVILEDPFEDPSGLIAPDMSPEATQERLANGRIGADEKVDETAGMSAKEIEELKEEREAKARATILEIVGDLPDADVAPPENVLFVCKLNPVTTDDDLSIIFNRFGKIKGCEIIRDKTTGDSLQYGFIEFEDQKSCEDAYFKMDNVLIDDRRIKVDFSQSVAKERKIRWRGKGKGIENLKPENIPNDKEIKSPNKPSNNHREREESKISRRDKDYEENQRRRERGKERDSDRYSRERGRDKGDERHHRGRQEREHKRDRSRSSHRRHDSKYRRDDYKDDSKRHDSSRKESGSSRKRDEDSRRTSSSRKTDEKRKEDRKLEEYSRERDRERRSTNDRNSNNHKDEKVKNTITRQSSEKVEVQDSEQKPKESSPFTKLNKSTDYHNDVKENSTLSGGSEKSFNVLGNEDYAKEDRKLCIDSPKSTRSDRREILKENKLRTGEEELGDDKLSHKSNDNDREINDFIDEKRKSRKKRRSSENMKKKKRRHSTSSDSSSESSDSSESSSSSDSSDCRRSKKKKLIIAKKYYRGGKLVKEVKKKRRTRDSSDSESISDESSDSDSNRKYKSKKLKKPSDSLKQPRRKSDISSDENSPSESSSGESDTKTKKKRKRKTDRHAKRKSKQTSKKKRKKRKETSSSSESENSNKETKSLKKLKKAVKS